MSEQIPRQRRIQRLQLEPFDDVVSVRDRLQFVKAGRVLLIFPDKHKILRRKLDLVLIQREAARRDLRLAIVTKDHVVADNAKDLELSAFYSIEEARTHRWKRPYNKVFVHRQERPQLQHDPYDLMMAATRLKPLPTAAQKARGRVVRGTIFGVTLLAVLFGLYALLPSASIAITPARDELNITINILADPNLDQPVDESLRIPATVERRLQDGTVTIETTGTRPAENSLAEGIVTFTNNTALAQFIPAGTIVQTESVPPIQFLTQEDAALPARQGATVNVAIRALDSNPPLSGNQPPGVITRVFGELSDSISVRNQNATYGEGVRDIAYVTPNDRERLQILARQQVRQNARDMLRISLDEASYLLVFESINIVEERQWIYSAEVNQPAETVTVTLQAVVEATIIDLAQAKRVALVNLSRYVSTGRDIDRNSLMFRPGDIQQVLEDGSVAFQMRIEGTTFVEIDSNQVRDRLTGLSVTEARTILETEYLLDPNQPPEIDTWPGFLNRMPLFPIRIHIDVRGYE